MVRIKFGEFKVQTKFQLNFKIFKLFKIYEFDITAYTINCALRVSKTDSASNRSSLVHSDLACMAEHTFTSIQIQSHFRNNSPPSSKL